MKLSKLSLLFSAALLLIVGINGSISMLVLRAFDQAQAVQDHRVEALRVVEELRRETDTLSRLVRAYAATGETRYLTYYYAILAIREGEAPAIQDDDGATFWDRVIAGQARFVPGGFGPRLSMRSRMVALGFQGPELAALEKVLAETEALKAIEQVAFAATQGLYDPGTRMIVSEGVPQPEVAMKLVFGRDYDRQRLRVATAVTDLMQRVDQRTGSEVTEARNRLGAWIIASVVSMGMTALLVLLAFRTTHRRVLRPLADMCALTGQLARGQYDVRLGGEDGVEEVQALSTTLNSMARAIETDIREREAIGRELQEARARAEQATQAKSMFLANMSHEIRTPLNAVIGMAELILHSRLLPRQREYAEKIRSAGRSLLDTLNDILDFSKIEAGRLELEDIPFRLEQVVADALQLVEGAAREKGVELIFEARSGCMQALDAPLIGDPLRIGQILGNLLSNAVKFTPAGHVSLRVGAEPPGDGVLLLSFSVEDTGIGMRAGQIEHLFEDFVQADGATTRQYGGTGLGLAIVRRLVEAMGGEVRVSSEPRRGSVFHVRLPLVLGDVHQSAPAALLPWDGLRVLVADDYPDVRLSLIDLLNLQGIEEVDAATSGAEVLECLQAARREAAPYDLLFLDWTLPDRDGGALLEWLRARPELAPRHIALMSMPRALDAHIHAIFPDGLHFCEKPLLPAALKRLGDVIFGRSEAMHGEKSPEAGSLDGMRVLLVEDNSTSRDVAVALMGRWGVEADSAADGRDALAQLAAQPADCYDLVFMDLQMPMMDGYEAVRRIRVQPAFDGLPIYALSAHSGRSVLTRCLAVGMNGCLAKPYEPSSLYAVLRKHHHGPARPAPAPLFQSGREAVTGLAGIPGIDPLCAINDTGVSPSLYPRLLAKFRDQFADGPQRLRADVESRAWERVVPFAHTLKGRAGLLGMSEISAIAGRLETAARARDSGRARAALRSLEEQLRPIVEGLGRVLPADAATDSLPASPTAGADVPELIQ
ncbi:hybrid sensor histidine kinase/response regulator [Zoogloea sp. LCSB751]|uniref:hybrid sensor histidine kinase/response regulator n=1 Tax=Zoogloea sp. LCSB751 TaxID=1965277 RepID=UPI0009A4CAFE|nr:hybrid sensor histidine kinase/response regulator [Zoogloea sp. LCSB751]